MQSFFHWDLPLLAPKKLKITELDLNFLPQDQVPEVTRDIHVIDEQVKDYGHPHQWLSGEGSTSTSASIDPKSKGKEIARQK